MRHKMPQKGNFKVRLTFVKYRVKTADNGLIGRLYVVILVIIQYTGVFL